jgi:hypothetical protein
MPFYSPVVSVRLYSSILVSLTNVNVLARPAPNTAG